MAEITLAQKPLNIAIGRRPHPIAAQSRLFATVAHGVRLMALQAVIAIDDRACRNGLRVSGEGVGALMIPGGDVLPTRARRGA